MSRWELVNGICNASYKYVRWVLILKFTNAIISRRKNNEEEGGEEVFYNRRIGNQDSRGGNGDFVEKTAACTLRFRLLKSGTIQGNCSGGGHFETLCLMLHGHNGAKRSASSTLLSLSFGPKETMTARL